MPDKVPKKKPEIPQPKPDTVLPDAGDTVSSGDREDPSPRPGDSQEAP